MKAGTSGIKASLEAVETKRSTAELQSRLKRKTMASEQANKPVLYNNWVFA